jgi:SAM-dependent methyltransferase
VTAPLDRALRRAFVDARRRSHEERMDRDHAPRYDQHWGVVSPTHDAFVRRLLELTRPHGTVLDAACGTGQYWPQLLGSGRTVIGTDQSVGMLRAAAEKFPAVPIGRIGLQDLRFGAAFDAVMCVDAMENVAPEDWPLVSARLAAAARPGAHLYLTVELSSDDELEAIYASARAAGHPVVAGESFDGVGYDYYPPRSAVTGWLTEAGLQPLEQTDGDDYWHLLLRRPT